MTGRPLTVRGVKMMLGRAGLDYSGLTITYDRAVWVDVETGIGTTSVKIEGPDSERHAAAAVLYDKGLSNAPYTGYDMWSRYPQRRLVDL